MPYRLLDPDESAGFLLRHQIAVEQMSTPYLVVRDDSRLVMLFKKVDGQLLLIDVTGAPAPEDFYKSAEPSIIGTILGWMDPTGAGQKLLYEFTQTRAGTTLEKLGNLVDSLVTGAGALAANLATVVIVLGGIYLLSLRRERS